MIERGYSLRTIQEEDIHELYNVFMASFAGNSVHFGPSFEQFERRIFQKLNINKDCSFLLFKKSEPIGFILHTIGSNAGIKTAYNGGIGIVPAFRGKHLSQQLYETALKQIKVAGANKVLLEVITTNKPAIRLYESLGFKFKRQLRSFKLHSEISPSKKAIEAVQTKSLNPQIESFWSYSTTFLDSSQHLKHNLKNEIILEVSIQKVLVGYLVFQPALGRISQLAVSPAHRNAGIGRALLSKAQKLSEQAALTIMNIPEEEENSILALEKLGFRNEVDQYEMELII